MLAGSSAQSLSFDAASHALDGLDIYDHLRLGRPDRAAASALRQSWWPPVHAILLVFSYAIFGRDLAAASVPSLLSYLVAPLLALGLSRRLLGVRGLWAAPVLGGLLVLSPMLLEMSGWIMFESLCGALALAAWWAFFGEDRRVVRVAFLLVTVIFLTKYHYGLFLGVTFLAALISEEPPAGRAALREAARSLARSRLAQVAVTLAAALFLAQKLLARRPGGAPAWMPESNVFLGLLVLGTIAAIAGRRRLAERSRELSTKLRDYIGFTILPAAAWLLLPGKVRGWYRQTFFDPPEEVARGFFENLASFGRAMASDYTSGLAVAALLVAGLLLALWPPPGVDRRRRLRWLALFAIWPPVLIAASPLPAEARFLGFVMPSLMTAATLGGLAWSTRWKTRAAAPLWAAIAAAVLALQILPLLREGEPAFASRAAYRYPNTPGENDFVARLLAAVPAGEPAVVVLDDTHRIDPTIRLALRLRSPGIPPGDIAVRVQSLDAAPLTAPGPGVLVAPASRVEAEGAERLGPIEPGGADYLVVRRSPPKD